MNKSASAAKKYYSEEYYSEGKGLDKYYSDKDQVIGQWHGKGAEQLGLSGDIKSKDFAALCDNRNPVDDTKLTSRDDIEKRVGYDFTSNASKSVSLAYAFGNEEQKKEILEAFRSAVNETMNEVEKGMLTRVRRNGQNTDRETGNIACGTFIHFTSRPVDGVPDPHLHAHCFVFNVTYDKYEDKWKAGQFGQIKKDAPYYEAVFHSRFADNLQKAGYAIERTDNSFELDGIKKETIDKFSLRTKEIEEVAAEHNITDSKQKSGIGAKTRESKRDALDADKILANWQSRLNTDEENSFRNLKNNFEKKKDNDDRPKEAIEYSLNHHLERKSVSTAKEILSTAIRASIGEASPEGVKEAFSKRKDVISVKEANQTFITTVDALQEENRLIASANEFKGRFKPLNENYIFKNESLSDEQKNAVTTALTTNNGITIIAGKAGTGKTTLMKEIQQGINEAGKQIYAFAPSAEASRVVQRKEGFENAETISLFLKSKKMQEAAKNSVIWIEEAGMVSNKDMNNILAIAKEHNARLILTGDIKQHASVERGDALRILQQEAGILPVMVSKIHRQKNAQYREAVQHLSKDDTDKGFAKLNKIGSINEIADSAERIDKVANDYYRSSYRWSGKQKEVLVVSPTHIEGDKVTEAIRERLKEKDKISKDEHQFLTLRNMQLTKAEKELPESYKAGNYLVFHQNIKGIKAGSRFQIMSSNDNAINVRDISGRETSINISNASAFNIFSAKQISISQGDKIRITGNGKSNEGVHLFNGTSYQVEGFNKAGDIRLSNGATISKDYANFTHGYVMTSHASQGKTVDKVIISQSSASFRASSKEQFYVSVSRGREAVAIYTDDKQELLNAVGRSGERRSAIELTRDRLNQQTVDINRLEMFSRLKEKAVSAAQRLRNAFSNKMNDYEQLQGKTAANKDKGR